MNELYDSLGFAAVVLAFLGGLALVIWAIGSGACNA